MSPSKTKKPRARSAHERFFEAALRGAGFVESHSAAYFLCDEWVADYRFEYPTSERELDFAWPGVSVAVEIQGGTGWAAHKSAKSLGHAGVAGYARDVQKLNDAQSQGWLVIWLTPKMVYDGRGIEWVKQAIGRRLKS